MDSNLVIGHPKPGRTTVELQRWRETVTALKSANSGTVVSSDKVHAWLASWGRDDELSPPEI